MKKLARSLLFLMLVPWATAPVLAVDGLTDFTTDGCSLFPDGSPVNPTLWCDCCVAHDVAYWRGGTETERREADETLRACVEERTGNKAFADLVYGGVRGGGHPVFPTWYRWAYGWSYGRGYEPLTEEEAALAGQKLQLYLEVHQVPACGKAAVQKVEGTDAETSGQKPHGSGP